MATIGQANIQLTADSAGFAEDLSRAQGSLDKFATASNRSLGKLTEIGEKFGSAIGRADAVTDAFNRLATTTGSKLTAGMDAAKASIGALVGSMMLAKSTGMSLMSGLRFGLAGLGVSLGLSALTTTPEAATGPGADWLRRRGLGGGGFRFDEAGLRSDADIETTRTVHGDAAAAFARRSSDAMMRAGAAGERAGGRADSWREERLAMLMTAEERERDRLRSERGRAASDYRAGLITGDTYAEMAREIARAEEELTALTAARERDRLAAERAAEAERARAEHARAYAVDAERARSVEESLRTPRERAIAELRELERLRGRGMLTEEAVRGRAAALAGGLAETGPIGPSAMGLGESATISAINAAGRRSGPTAEDLLMEVRAELEAIRAAIGTVGTSVSAGLGGVAGILRGP